MGFRFSENIEGTLFPHNGLRPQVLSLKATIYVPRIIEACLGRPMLIRGHLYIDGTATGYRAEGTVTLDLRGSRRITYDLDWRDESGSLNRLYGAKTLELRRPIASCTEVSAQVIRAGDLRGQARLCFSLRTLPSLLASLRPL